MKLRISFFLIVVTALAAGINGCKPDDTPEDPCEGKSIVNASYKVEERIGDRWFSYDTVSGVNEIRFRASQASDDYFWTIGSETLTNREFIRTRFPESSWIESRLIATKQPDRNCFPNAKSKDTTEQSFFSWHAEFDNTRDPVLRPFPVWGTYRGVYADDPTKTIDVTLKDTFYKKNDVWENHAVIVGLPEAGVTSRSEPNIDNVIIRDFCPSAGAKAVHIDVRPQNWGGSPFLDLVGKMHGYAWLKDNDRNIVIEISYKPAGSSQELNRRFEGVKID